MFLKKIAILPAALETRVLGLSVFPGNLKLLDKQRLLLF